ncbi:hypothetical protein TRIUR3_06718 [Triticum urartu]|uniref:DUF1618 domain-containing protein n=1 Tax=Triticum urartu TaxID=4572 RepID=M7Z0W7_TRIUA|nr:hypothetical protein TRIUR3_06718 [Triticum urartu]
MTPAPSPHPPPPISSFHQLAPGRKAGCCTFLFSWVDGGGGVRSGEIRRVGGARQRDPAQLNLVEPNRLGEAVWLQVIQGDPAPRLAPTTSAPLSPYPDCDRSRALDCRHGRVLLHVWVRGRGWHFTVWDPVTGDQQSLPEPGIPWLIYTAAVFCPVAGCGHLDCHGGPFRVVFVATDDYDELVKAAVYSSGTAAWSTPVTLDDGCESYVRHRRDVLAADGSFYYIPYVEPRRGVVIGDETYFTLREGNAIIKYDWAKNCISMVDPPDPNVYDDVALMAMEDGSLGFPCLENSSLCLFSRKVNAEGDAEWMRCRAIKLEKVIPVANPDEEPVVVGCAEGVGVIFLNSGLVKKVAESGKYFSVLPYMGFYTPDRGRFSSLARLTDV